MMNTGKARRRKAASTRKSRLRALALTAALALTLTAAIPPRAALAVTEGEVEAAPDVELSLGALAAPWPADYLPDEDYFIDEQLYDLPVWGTEEEYVTTQWDELGHIARPYVGPGMTPGEAARARKLLAAYQAGEVDGDGASVLEATQDVKVGVYALNPEDFDGEQVFTILHAACLTDEEILAIIDACAQLGLTFDPSALSYRNCLRGGMPMRVRSLTQEERERGEAIETLIRRGMLSAQDASGAQLKVVELNWTYALGLDKLVLTPYRRLTDGELLQYELAHGASADEGAAMDRVEARAREALCDRFGLPLSMALTSVSTQAAFDVQVHDHIPKDELDVQTCRAFAAEFDYVSDAGYLATATVSFEEETGELAWALISESNPARILSDGNWIVDPDISAQTQETGQEDSDRVSQEAAFAAAKAYCAKLGYTDCVWKPLGETETLPWLPGWGKCWSFCAKAEEGLFIDLNIGCDDGQVHRVYIDAIERFAE